MLLLKRYAFIALLYIYLEPFFNVNINIILLIFKMVSSIDTVSNLSFVTYF